jgi:hemerythrin-like domain-containing protein
VTLTRIGSGPPPSFDDPVAVLLHSHKDLEHHLSVLERAAAALAQSPEDSVAAIREVLRHLDTAGVRHTDDEEASVWPRVNGEALGPLLDDLSLEHRAMEAITLALRDVVARAAPPLYPELAAHANALCAAYRDHLRREEDEIFPAARALDPKELRAIGIEMRLRRGGTEI